MSAHTPKQEYQSDCICDTECRRFVNVKCKVAKQETLEEAANKQWGNVHRTGVLGFIEGAQWQSKQNQSELESLRAERDGLVEALRWTSVEDKLPKPLQTVWLSNGKGWVSLGCLVEGDCGWHWAESNGVTYLENGEIVSECESEDLDVKFWIALPKPPNP